MTEKTQLILAFILAVVVNVAILAGLLFKASWVVELVAVAVLFVFFVVIMTVLFFILTSTLTELLGKSK